MVIALTTPCEPSIAPVDWTHVRLVYKKLQDDFHLITGPFGITISESKNLHLSHLIGTIDSIDRTLDTLPVLEDRSSFANALVAFLNGETETIESDFATEEVGWRMDCLRLTVVECDIQKEFCATVEKIFALTELKRTAISEREMIDHMREEWRLTGHLTILVLGSASTPKFESFFYLCCEMMTAVDMIQDAFSDYRSGQISVRPWPSLYLRLLAEFALPFPKLIWRFPKPQNLFRYAGSFLFEVYWPFKWPAKRSAS